MHGALTPPTGLPIHKRSSQLDHHISKAAALGKRYARNNHHEHDCGYARDCLSGQLGGVASLRSRRISACEHQMSSVCFEGVSLTVHCRFQNFAQGIFDASIFSWWPLAQRMFSNRATRCTQCMKTWFCCEMMRSAVYEALRCGSDRSVILKPKDVAHEVWALHSYGYSQSC